MSIDISTETVEILRETKNFYRNLIDVVGQLSNVYSERGIELADYFVREKAAADMRGEIGDGGNPYNNSSIVRNADELKQNLIAIKEAYDNIIDLLYEGTTPDYVDEEDDNAYMVLKSVENLARYMREHGDNLEPAITKFYEANMSTEVDKEIIDKAMVDTRIDYAQIKAIFQNRSE